MAKELRVKSFTGSPKRLTSNLWTRIMSSNAAVNHNSAALVTTEEVLNLGSAPDMLIIECGSWIRLRFTTDSGGSNGQGITIPSGLKDIRVSDVSGSVKRLEAKYINYSMVKTDAYSNGNAVTAQVDDLLYPGDVIVGSNSTCYFELTFEAPDKGYSPTYFVGLPLGHCFLSDY